MAWKELNLDCNKSSLKTIINITENSRYEIVQCTTSSRTRALQSLHIKKSFWLIITKFQNLHNLYNELRDSFILQKFHAGQSKHQKIHLKGKKKQNKTK